MATLTAIRQLVGDAFALRSYALLLLVGTCTALLWLIGYAFTLRSGALLMCSRATGKRLLWWLIG